MSKEIKLTKGYITIVDDEDFERVSKFKWQVSVTKTNNYARRTVGSGKNKKTIRLHNYVLEIQDTVDHINGDGLDNRKENLRVCRREENAKNRKLNCNNISGYKGVRLEYGKWRAQIKVNGKRVHLGMFAEKMDAAKAYDEAALKYHGEFARLNFPNLKENKA